MTARTHDLAAITALGIVLISQPVRTVSVSAAIVVVLANQLGGIAPDLDQPTAPFWRNLPIGGYIGRIIDKMLGGHRFITHSLIGLALMGFLLHLLLVFLTPIMPSIDTGYVWWAFMIGVISHLILDTFTKEGVPWLLPIPVKFGLPPFKKMRITTGKLAEKLLFFGLLAFNLWFISSHYTKMVDIIHHIS
jgi:inner membrane protein